MGAKVMSKYSKADRETDFARLAVDLESTDFALHGRIRMLVAHAMQPPFQPEGWEDNRYGNKDAAFHQLNANIAAAFVEHGKRVDQVLDEFKQAIAK
jgi:hypothetical protein